MTRTTDTLIALDDRPRIANHVGADLFLSIHTNALNRPQIAGFETYFLAVAKTEEAERVAQMENAAIRFDRRPGVELDPITFMLRDLVQNAYLIESLRWAELVQQALAESLDAPNRGVKQAGFYVLVGANMPSVLAEIGYITNPREEQRLRSQAYQRRVAEALARSIETYLRSYGPRFEVAGTRR
jgi:N-acetylmuramoyl-L-alanine amidase